jgi:myo-inositol-1(or 4)-monophosphatase
VPNRHAEAAEVAASIGEVARLAGRELLERMGAERTVTHKGAIDLVTDADRASEEVVVRELSRRHPGAAVLAEEGGARAGAGLRFVVDPLDGTTNYAAGVPHFAVSIGAEDAEGLVAGAVYDPCRDELFLAARAGGATMNGTPLRVREAALGEAVLATGFPYDVRTQGRALFDRFEAVVRRARAVRRFGSAALDLAWTAQGRYHGYWERGLQPWDVAAGLLLVREAGGVCVDYRGAEAALAGGEVVAGAPGVVRELVAALAVPSAAQER